MGKVIRIQTDDGEGVVDPATGNIHIDDGLGGIIIRKANAKKQKTAEESDHNDNLAEAMDEGALGTIASDLLQAIESDWQSSGDRRTDIEKAIKLLAIRVEDDKSAPVAGMSTIRSPLMLEANLMFQANAAAELLPASGPCKMRHDGEETQESLKLTEDLERDFNHYLTTTASEYYPDTTRMLFDNVGLAGAGFKKVFHCPLRRRPVSESVASEDLIVNAGATDLRNAQRVTQRILMAQSRLKRLQLAGHYRDVPVGQPTETATALDTAKAMSQGLGASPQLPASYRHTIYECYCELDLPGYEHKEAGEVTGLPLPYRVSIETQSSVVLEIRRDWDEDDEQYERRRTFCKWPFIEALGFYGLGLMHILGNTTEALTAAWRILLDAGMFSTFPGWLYAKDATRGQETTQFRVAAGSGVGINTGGKAIGDVIMPLPYKGPDAAFIQLSSLLDEAARRVGGIANTAVGEGKQEAPVGTTIALLEQGTKMMASVHKGLHAAQSEEFQMLKERFKEDPDAFWRHNKKPSRSWDRDQFIAALDDNDIVPSADPNTPSHMHRIMRAIALVQLATTFPELTQPREVMKIALKVLGWDPTAVMSPEPAPDAQKGPDTLPIDPVGMAAVEAKKAGDALKAQTEEKKIAADTQESAADRQSKEKIAGAELQQESAKAQADIVAQREKLTMEARLHAMRALGVGNRVI